MLIKFITPDERAGFFLASFVVRQTQMTQLLEIPKSSFTSESAYDELSQSGLATDSRFAALCNASHGVVVQMGNDIPRCFGVSGDELTEFASIPLSLVLKDATTAEQLSKSLASEFRKRPRAESTAEQLLNIWSFESNPADKAFDIWTDELRPILSLVASVDQLSWIVEGQGEVSQHAISLEEAEGLIAVSLESVHLPATQPAVPFGEETDPCSPIEGGTTIFLDRFQLAQMEIEQDQETRLQIGATLFSPSIVAKVSINLNQVIDTTYFSINGSGLAVWTPQQDGVTVEYLAASESRSRIEATLERCLGAALRAASIESPEFAFDIESEDPGSSIDAPRMVQAADSRNQFQFSVEAVRMDADMLVRGVAFNGFASPEIGLWEIEQKLSETESGLSGLARQLAGSDLTSSIDAVLSPGA